MTMGSPVSSPRISEHPCRGSNAPQTHLGLPAHAHCAQLLWAALPVTLTFSSLPLIPAAHSRQPLPKARTRALFISHTKLKHTFVTNTFY